MSYWSEDMCPKLIIFRVIHIHRAVKGAIVIGVGRKKCCRWPRMLFMIRRVSNPQPQSFVKIEQFSLRLTPGTGHAKTR
jgi:hypothetical protein